MNKKSLFIIPLSVLMLVGCNGKNSGGSTTPVEETFTVVWKNYDGTVLETDTGLKKGETPTYDSADPTRDATAQYTYTFNGWSPEVVAVTQDAEYTATYSETVNQYTVSWVVNGEQVKTQTVEYGATVSWTEAAPTKASTAEYEYTFTGWDYDLANPITGNTTITAEFSSQKRSYTITFKNDDGTEIEHHSVEYGQMPVCETTPEKEGTTTYNYDFAGWDNEIATVTGEATYTATFVAVPLDFSDMGDYYRCNGLKNNSYAGEVNIPSTWKGKPVQTIYEYGFASCPNITGVTIPSSVIDIGQRAFQNSSITSVSIPGSVQTIPDYTFYNCSKLANIEFHEGTRVIGQYAFSGVAIRELKLVDSLTTVSGYAFSECRQLVRLETATGDGIANCTFGNSVFYKSSSLTEVVNNTESVDSGAISNIFNGYPTYNYVSRYTNAENKGTFEFEESPAASGELQRIFYTYPGNSQTYLVGAFGSGNILRTGKATRVKKYAFSLRSDIKTLYIGASMGMEGLESAAFSACGITSLTFEGNDYLEIGQYAFEDCRDLTTIDWGTRKVLVFRSQSFAGCRNLNITLPTNHGELILYDECFVGVANTSLEVTANVKAIDGNPFLDMPNLTTLTVASGNQYFKAVDNVLFTLDGTTLVCYADNKPETSYVVPSGVTTIGRFSMTKLNNLVSVTLPSTLTKLGSPCLNGQGEEKGFTISYDGTVEDFSKVQNVNGWWKDNYVTTVTCSDGTWPA